MNIKSLLMSQTLVAGLGNIYVDEVLWQSRINPLTPANELTKDQVKCLHSAINETIEEATKYGGTTVHSFLNAEGESGHYQEKLKVYGKEGQRISFAPDPSWRLGPYLGWRWVFLGYTLDLKHINTKDNHSSKKEFNLSLYSSLLGVDLFWRQTGNDYHIQRMNLGDHINTDALRKVSFDGFKSSIKGLNLYYIFNHRKFSYPAAYSQSTRQKKSAGSWMVGLGYTQHQLEVDWDKLSAIVDERLNQKTKQQLEAKIDSSLMFSKVKYSDYSATVGYGYNWVFAKNWLFNASLSVGLAYNHSKSGDPEKDKFDLKNFNFKNFNFDGIGRFGVVWNNDRWYAGASTVIHSYNYHKDHFSTNNSFGSLNIYVGVNFGKKREYKNVK